MSTGARGETAFQANGREVRVLYTNRALADAEQRVGKSIMAIARGLQDESTTLGETVVLLRVGMEAARRDAGQPGPSISMNDAYAVMDAAGFGPTAVAVMEAVGAVLSHGQDELDDEKNV